MIIVTSLWYHTMLCALVSNSKLTTPTAHRSLFKRGSHSLYWHSFVLPRRRIIIIQSHITNLPYPVMKTLGTTSLSQVVVLVSIAILAATAPTSAIDDDHPLRQYLKSLHKTSGIATRRSPEEQEARAVKDFRRRFENYRLALLEQQQQEQFPAPGSLTAEKWLKSFWCFPDKSDCCLQVEILDL